VLDVAWDLLLTGGYAGLNMDEVAERAAGAKTILYRRWPTKDGRCPVP
jgi:AcrR family transcriptional regulator